MTDPIRPTDDDARDLATGLLTHARHAALGVVDPATAAPMVSRVAMIWQDGAIYLLVSDLSLHTKALAQNSACSLLVSGPDAKGDPLNHPRLTVQCSAGPAHKAALRDPWLARHPKSKLYFDFADFNAVQLRVHMAYLNGGFGRAFHLQTNDLM